MLRHQDPQIWKRVDKRRKTYRNLEINKLLCESTHLIIEAEPIFSRLTSREHEITLSFLLSIKNDFISRSYNLIIDIERTSSLNLSNHQSNSLFTIPSPKNMENK